MFTCDGSEVLDFKINYKITKRKRVGLFRLSTINDETVILNDVKGRIESGTLTAILGASGSGKTSLLAALSMRLRDELSGEIRFNGEVMSRERMTRISGFAAQSDVSLEGITVSEHLYFMIELKLPYIAPFEKQHLIYSSLNKFGLDANTKLKYLSGGEKKKLSLATELLTRPHLLFCDEISTGLDSFNAYSVISTLKELAGYTNERKLFQKPLESRIVVVSIHQPSSDVFHLFTNIILMNAGRIIFHGTTQEAEKLFTSMSMPCPPCYNPAEFYINIISDTKKSTEIIKFISSNEKVEHYDETQTSCSSSLKSYENGNESQRQLPWLRQCRIISHRAILNFLRAPNHYLIELLILIILSTIIMLVYLRISFESNTSVQDINGFLLMMACEILFTFVYAVFTLIYIELPLLRKETGNRLYTLSAYYVSLVVMMIPKVVFETLIYTAIIYFSTDVGREFSTFLNISFAIMLSGLCAMAYGFFLSGIFESFFVGTELSGILDLVLMLASGMYINVDHVKWLKYISFFYYANETVAINFWSKVDEIKCDHDSASICLRNGTQVLEHFGYNTTVTDIYKDYIYQFILTVVLHIFAFIGIKRNVQKTGFY